MATTTGDTTRSASGPSTAQRRADGGFSKGKRPRSGSFGMLTMIGGFVGIAIVAYFGATRWLGLSGDDAQSSALVKQVAVSDMLITVVEDGTLESASNIDVKCLVPGGSTIQSIVEDGKEVQAGEEIIRLDSAALEELADLQEIVVERARSTLFQAEKNLAVAEIAVKEYLEGTFVKELQTVEGLITIAEENLRSAQNNLEYTSAMHRKGYVTSLALEAADFSVRRAELDLESAQTSKKVLEEFTKAKMLEDLRSQRDTAEAQLSSEKAAFEMEEARLIRYREQIQNCVYTAPQSGMVVYANEQDRRRGSTAPSIEEGAMVRESQTIIKLPDLSQMQVKVTVHESKVDLLEVGMRARIQIQDRELQGTVTNIANQPEPSSSFFGAGVKEYAATVRIDGEPAGLKPGMTAEVEILVAHIKDAVSVPVQAIVEQGGEFVCWVQTPNGPERRQVLVGASNSTDVQVRDGLAAGDTVLLNPRAVVPEAREEVAVAEDAGVDEQFGEGAEEGARNSVPEGAGRTMGGTMGAASGETANADGPAADPVAKFDTDGDNKLSRDEAPEQMKARFDQLDANSDGTVDRGEISAARAASSAAGGGAAAVAAPEG